jgi:hypothetical protein
MLKFHTIRLYIRPTFQNNTIFKKEEKGGGGGRRRREEEVAPFSLCLVDNHKCG